MVLRLLRIYLDFQIAFITSVISAWRERSFSSMLGIENWLKTKSMLHHLF